MKKNILIVDDDLFISNLLDNYFRREGYGTFVLSRGTPVIPLLQKEAIDAVICDLRLPDIQGAEVLGSIRRQFPDIPVIMMTAYAGIRAAVDSMRAGAFDYMTKPVIPSEISATIKKAMNHSQAAEADCGNEFLTGKSRRMLRIIEQARLVAPTDMSVIIQGETGSGKEYIARLIHRHSMRSKKNFVAIDCGAIPKELAASELFGHVKGAFTGAISGKTGYFEQANGGTIFLDEIGNLSYDTQVKLLRAIQQKVITRVGDSKPIKVDVRIICASNRNLLEATGGGYFREDLYHRINEFKIELPSLRHRGEDIMIFARHFLQQANQQLGKQVKDFDPGVIKIFKAYAWYGNLRELRNVIKRCVLIAREERITPDCLPEELSPVSRQGQSLEIHVTGSMNLRNASREAERSIVQAALQEANNNKSLAARILNIDRKTLYNKLHRLGLKG